jgi:hypothetical protein
VQFHPEFDGAILRSYLQDRRAEIEAEGIDVDDKLRTSEDARRGNAVLCRFLARLAVAEPTSE